MAKVEPDNPLYNALKKMKCTYEVLEESKCIIITLPNAQAIRLTLRDLAAMIEQAHYPITRYINLGELTIYTFHDWLIQEMKVIIHHYKKKPTDGYREYDDSRERGNAKDWRRTFNSSFHRTAEPSGTLSKYHILLGVDMNVTKDSLKKAYRKASMEWHPDRNQHRPEEAKKKQQEINEAYQILDSITK